MPRHRAVASGRAACSCSFLDGHPVLDINYVEEAAGGPELTVGILPRSKRLSYLEVRPRDDRAVRLTPWLTKQAPHVSGRWSAQMESRVHSDRFEIMLETAVAGCDAVYQALDKVVRERMQQLLDARGA